MSPLPGKRFATRSDIKKGMPLADTSKWKEEIKEKTNKLMLHEEIEDEYGNSQEATLLGDAIHARDEALNLAEERFNKKDDACERLYLNQREQIARLEAQLKNKVGEAICPQCKSLVKFRFKETQDG